MGISILTYCSKAYEPAFRWVLPSWQRDEIERIIVVADFQIDDPGDSRVEWRADYEPSEDWFTNSTRRVGVAKKYLPDGLVAFLDLDCWIRGPIRPAFGAPDTISVTRFWSREPHTGGTITSGTWYANVGLGVRQFILDWEYLTNQRGRWHSAPGGATTQQYTFTMVCKQAFATGLPCHINTVPEQLFNCEHSRPEELIRKISENNPAVIHFKGGGWKDQEFVERALASVKGKQ